MMKGVAVNVVQTLLGHATIATTMRYAHVPASSLTEAVNLLSSNSVPLEDFGQPVGNRDISLVPAESIVKSFVS